MIVDVVALGQDLWLPYADPEESNQYLFEKVDGTSFASPYVAGVAALLFMKVLALEQVKEVLRKSTLSKASFSDSTKSGYGMLHFVKLAEILKQHPYNTFRVKKKKRG